MNIALVYDTETQGLPLFSEPSEHPAQPHLVQLGAILVDLDTRITLASMDVIIRPDGWVIPDEVSAIHGITTEMAMDLGVPEASAVEMFLGMWKPERPRIAHNETFDARILRIALKRHIDPRTPDAPSAPSDDWKAGRAECTAKMTTKLCALPPTAKMRAAGRNNFKTPKLSEAYLHCTGKVLEGAHNAMVDCLACRDVYFHVTAGAAVAA